MLQTTREIIDQLERAILLSEKDRSTSRIIVMACRYAIQIHALEFAKERLQGQIRDEVPKLSEPVT